MSGSFVDTIILQPIATSCYVQKVVTKKTIVIHHTAGEDSAPSVFGWWTSQHNGVSTPFVIQRDGRVYQCFSSQYSCWHLGLHVAEVIKPATVTQLNYQAVGIEMTNWGYLIEKDDKYINYDGGTVPANQVTTYSTPYKGYKFYQSYSTAQLDSLKQLIVYLADKYKINVKYKGDEMFEVDKRALAGEAGLWTHTSYRVTGKEDCHPQPELIAMLQTL